MAKTSVVAGQLYTWLESTLSKEELYREVPEEPVMKQPALTEKSMHVAS